MIDFYKIIKNAFGGKVEILKEINGGLRCETYLVKSKGEKYIFQIYIDKAIYQAKKKYDILNKINNKFIPKAIKAEEHKEYSYLITEYLEGETLHYHRIISKNIPLAHVFNELAKVLVYIHNIKCDKFGWIDNHSINAKDRFIDYIDSEYNRLINCLNLVNLKTKDSILFKVNNAIDIIKTKTENIHKSSLCWYDMNPGNILIKSVKGDYRLSALIDPGGARLGIPEWDIAFIKMQVCTTQIEFDLFMKEYNNVNADKVIDMELVNALSVIVELDTIYIEIMERVIIQPIPYDTNFKTEIETIHKGISYSK